MAIALPSCDIETSTAGVSRSSCSHLPDHNSPDGEGRRIYIHTQSFRQLTSVSAAASQIVLNGLMPIPAVKLAHHRFSMDGVSLGIVTEQFADSIMGALDKKWGQSITECLRAICYRPRQSGKPHRWTRVLCPNESVVATCFDSDYFTFATTEAAADRMYRDVEDMGEVRRLLHVRDPRYADLTLIHGDSLSLFNEGSPHRRRNSLGAGISLASKDEFGAIKNHVLNRFKLSLGIALAPLRSNASAREAQLLDAYSHDACLAAEGIGRLQ